MPPSDERRADSLNQILIEQGKLIQIATDTKKDVCDLKDRVGTQNGRIGKLEESKSILKGMLIIVSILMGTYVARYLPEILQTIGGS